MECRICLSTIDSRLRAIPDCCDHTFCVSCLFLWSNNRNTCPIDRKMFFYIHLIDENDTDIRQIEVSDICSDYHCVLCRRDDREKEWTSCEACGNLMHTSCRGGPLYNVRICKSLCRRCNVVDARRHSDSHTTPPPGTSNALYNSSIGRNFNNESRSELESSPSNARALQDRRLRSRSRTAARRSAENRHEAQRRFRESASSSTLSASELRTRNYRQAQNDYRYRNRNRRNIPNSGSERNVTRNRATSVVNNPHGNTTTTEHRPTIENTPQRTSTNRNSPAVAYHNINVRDANGEAADTLTSRNGNEDVVRFLRVGLSRLSSESSLLANALDSYDGDNEDNISNSSDDSSNNSRHDYRDRQRRYRNDHRR